MHYSEYKGDCPLLNTLFIKQKFFSALKTLIFPIANFLKKIEKKDKLHSKELGAKEGTAVLKPVLKQVSNLFLVFI